LETEREASERKNLEELEKAYNQELMTASELITVYIHNLENNKR
jgi:hypothetical protein